MKRRLLLVLGAIVAVLAIGAGLAWATIPDAQGVIHGCRRDTTGVLRVIDTDAGQTCAGNETPLDWNQTGPAGPPGSGTDYEAITVSVTGPSVPASCSPGKFLVHHYADTGNGPNFFAAGPNYVLDGEGRITGVIWPFGGFDFAGTIICVTG